ncbi:uncharacterized protein LOC144166791 [Haemaphysalis longicornis]
MHPTLLLACLLASAIGATSEPWNIAVVRCMLAADDLAMLLPGDGQCAYLRVFVTNREMWKANCTNCNKYFNCLGNSRAVNLCNNSTMARRAAQIAGDCLQKADAGGDESAITLEANLLGRNGGDCASEYLATVGCAYNPDTKTCGEATTIAELSE